MPQTHNSRDPYETQVKHRKEFKYCCIRIRVYFGLGQRTSCLIGQRLTWSIYFRLQVASFHILLKANRVNLLSLFHMDSQKAAVSAVPLDASIRWTMCWSLWWCYSFLFFISTDKKIWVFNKMHVMLILISKVRGKAWFTFHFQNHWKIAKYFLREVWLCV